MASVGTSNWVEGTLSCSNSSKFVLKRFIDSKRKVGVPLPNQ